MSRHTGPHDAGTAAAAYLGGAMTPPQRREHEQHLLACDDCWTEVDLGRRGRTLAEDARELVPAGLLERIRAEVEDAASSTPRPLVTRRPSRRRVLSLAAGVLAVVAAERVVQAGEQIVDGHDAGGALAAVELFPDRLPEARPQPRARHDRLVHERHCRDRFGRRRDRRGPRWRAPSRGFRGPRGW